jgi:Holliday junction resolvase
MRRVCRVDSNQREIVQVLRELGCSIAHTHVIGRGFPDLIVGYGGHNYLIEIKDGSKPPSKQRLTPDEEAWHTSWRGQIAVVNSIAEALNVCGCS